MKAGQPANAYKLQRCNAARSENWICVHDVKEDVGALWSINRTNQCGRLGAALPHDEESAAQ